jgi:excisionase family DNA binding protein
MPLEQSEFWTGRKLPRIQRAPLLSVADVAEDLNLSIRTIRRLIAQQKLSVVRIGNYQVDVPRLSAYIPLSLEDFSHAEHQIRS